MFLAILQCICTVIILGILAKNGTIHFKKGTTVNNLFSLSDLKMIFPLPILFFLNLICGLGGTKKINIAMFTALRRFSILFMMILEIYLPMGLIFTTPVRVSVGVIVLGGIVAALNDLAFDFVGYMLIMGNNVFGALQGVVMKMKLSETKQLTKFGLLYYNSMCSVPIFMLMIMILEPDLQTKLRQYEHWGNPVLSFCLCGSIVLGVILNYAIFWCTQVNSATTTAVVGSMKNLITAYASILGLGGDYVFSYLNFLGLNISMAGAIVYSYYKLAAKKKTTK
jgi:solute carrier family 35